MKNLVVSVMFFSFLFVSAGCSRQESGTAPRGVSVMESEGRATLQISEESWSATSCSVKLHSTAWVLDLYQARPTPDVFGGTADEEPAVRLRLKPYPRLTVRFVDAKGTTIRNEELTRSAPSDDKK